jgi:hypothetical protein
MLKLTPDPPHVTHAVDFGEALHPLKLFTVRAGIPVDEALSQAVQYLLYAQATALELAESAPVALRPLALSTFRLIENAKALVDASNQAEV